MPSRRTGRDGDARSIAHAMEETLELTACPSLAAIESPAELMLRSIEMSDSLTGATESLIAFLGVWEKHFDCVCVHRRELMNSSSVEVTTRRIERPSIKIAKFTEMLFCIICNINTIIFLFVFW